MVSHSHLYCLQCGAGNLPHAKFCVVCGHSLQLDSSIPLPAIPKASLAPAEVSSHAPIEHSLLKQRYRILARIGQGGFAEVYKAADTQFSGRFVAIKAMSIEGLSTQELSEATEAFEREAFMLANLMHPNLPAIYDYFQENQHWYLVMSFIEGTTLEEYLHARGGRLPVEKVLPIGIQLCSVLSYLHKRKPAIIFRDLKLANVMRTPERQLYLIDFGVARLFKHGKTHDTIALGSPGYAAPEQYGKAQTTPQADIYSLGATLHALLSGADPSDMPFRFAPLHIPAYPDLNTLLMSMLENDAHKRPSSMSLVKQELQRIALGHTSQWAQQNWQQNILHYADKAKPFSPPPSPSIQRGLRPLQNPNKPPQNVLHSSEQARPALAPFPQQPGHQFAPIGQQQMFYQALPPQHSSVPPVSRRALIIGGVGSFFVLGGLLSYLAAQLTRHEAPISPPPVQATVNPIPTAQSQTQNPAINPAAFFVVSYSPDGTHIIAGNGSGQVNVLDRRGNLITSYTGHNGAITGLAWSPDNRLVASGSYDTTVQIWNPYTGQTVAIYKQNNGAVDALSWSHDGQYIASSDYTHTVLVWNVASQQTVQTYSNHRDHVKTLSWSSDNRYIASGSADSSVQVWEAMTGKILLAYQGHTEAVESVSWSPHSMLIASGSNDRTVHVWNALSGNRIYVYSGHNAPVTALAWSPDGHSIASGSQDTTVQVWSALDGRLLFIYRGHTGPVLSLDWSSSGNIVSTDTNGNLRVWQPT